MKNPIVLLLLFALTTGIGNAQNNITKLSSKAAKGYLYSYGLDEGQLAITYKMPEKKKSKEVTFEQYTFDTSLNFTGVNSLSELKKTASSEALEMPNITRESLEAYVGGNNSFNVNSIKLKINLEEWEQKWNSEKKQYDKSRRLKSTTLRPKNDVERYMGHASYAGENGNLLILASYDAPKKKEGHLFNLLNVNTDLDIEEIPVTNTPGYSLVYTSKLENGNICMILAPESGNHYLYKEFTNTGKESVNITFQAPSPNTLIFDHSEKDGVIYFVALSRNNNDPYPKVFEDYAPIMSPDYPGAANYQQYKFEKKAFDKDAENLHLLKFENSKLVFASTNPVRDLASKLKTPDGQKKGTAYSGKRFDMQKSYISPSGDFFLVGQISKRKTIATKTVGYGSSFFGDPTVVTTYLDIVCLHFDKNGTIKAQYAVNKLLNDKKSQIFAIKNNFIPSADNKTIYWEMLEVKGAEGYRDFSDAMEGRLTYYAHYFPRIAKIDINEARLSKFEVMHDPKGEYLLYNNSKSLIWDEANRTRYYLSRDKKYKNLAVSKYAMP